MRDAMHRLRPVLELARVTQAFAAVANVWFVILWTRAHPEHESASQTIWSRPVWILLVGGAVAAVGLYAFAMALNDILDLRRDRALRPDRPLPSGRIGVNMAVSIAVCTLLIAVLGATLLGIEAVVLTIVLSGAILVFNAAGKFVPGFGLVLLGLIYAGHMVVPNLDLRFVWPVWLVMTHALVIAGVAYRLGRKVPRISSRAMGFAAAGWVFWSGVILGVGWWRNRDAGGLWPDWVSPAAAIGPILLAGLFVVFAWRRVRQIGPGPRAAEKVSRYGSVWLSFYACVWMFGQGLVAEGVILTVLTVLGLLGMTVLRELYGLMEMPLGFRR